MASNLEIWDLWYPGPGAAGLPFARSRVDGKDTRERVLVHAAPMKLDVIVRDPDGNLIAIGKGLGQPGPMSYLVRSGKAITLEDGWPTAADLGRVVLLPGGEAGILKSWWNADEHSEWRWQVEFYNHR